MTIKNAAGECVRLRYFARDDVLVGNTIRTCGVADFRFGGGDKNGEGIYIGTADDQLKDGRNPTSDRDESRGNLVRGNLIDTQGAECVNIKETSTGNTIESNTCTGQRDPNSGGLNVQGNDNVLRDNEVYGNVGAGIRLGGATRTDGIGNDVYDNVLRDNETAGLKVMASPQGKVCGNTFSGNGGGDVIGTYRAEVDADREGRLGRPGPAERCRGRPGRRRRLQGWRPGRLRHPQRRRSLRRSRGALSPTSWSPGREARSRPFPSATAGVACARCRCQADSSTARWSWPPSSAGARALPQPWPWSGAGRVGKTWLIQALAGERRSIVPVAGGRPAGCELALLSRAAATAVPAGGFRTSELPGVLPSFLDRTGGGVHLLLCGSTARHAPWMCSMHRGRPVVPGGPGRDRRGAPGRRRSGGGSPTRTRHPRHHRGRHLRVTRGRHPSGWLGCGR